MKRVVVTGMGMSSPLGNDLATFERNMFQGRSGVRGIRGTLVAENFPVPYAAFVDTTNMRLPGPWAARAPESNSKYWYMSAHATREAVKSLPPGAAIDGIVYGTADVVTAAMMDNALQDATRDPELKDYDWTAVRYEAPLEVANDVLREEGFPAVPERNLYALNSACATGAQAIGLGLQRIRSGRWKRCLVGGVDARANPNSLMNFHMLSALTTADVPPETASRPFSGDRSGFVRGEASAVLVLEDLDTALARGAHIYGEVLGYANTSDAYRLTDGREDGASVMAAMNGAIRDAGITADQIDYVNAHGTSTPLNDRLETMSLKKVLGDRAKSVPVSSLKSQMGHSTVAAAAIETIATFLMLEKQIIAPTINYHTPDPELDLDYVPNEARPAPFTHVLKNSFGFGGQNSCLVLKRWDATGAAV